MKTPATRRQRRVPSPVVKTLWGHNLVTPAPRHSHEGPRCTFGRGCCPRPRGSTLWCRSCGRWRCWLPSLLSLQRQTAFFLPLFLVRRRSLSAAAASAVADPFGPPALVPHSTRRQAHSTHQTREGAVIELDTSIIIMRLLGIFIGQFSKLYFFLEDVYISTNLYLILAPLRMPCLFLWCLSAPRAPFPHPSLWASFFASSALEATASKKSPLATRATSGGGARKHKRGAQDELSSGGMSEDDKLRLL